MILGLWQLAAPPSPPPKPRPSPPPKTLLPAPTHTAPGEADPGDSGSRVRPGRGVWAGRAAGCDAGGRTGVRAGVRVEPISTGSNAFGWSRFAGGLRPGTQVQARAHARAHAQACTRTHAHARTHTYTHASTRKHTPTHVKAVPPYAHANSSRGGPGLQPSGRGFSLPDGRCVPRRRGTTRNATTSALVRASSRASP
jgi:hypothetical protein